MKSEGHETEVLDFIESSLKEIEALRVKNAELQEEKVILEKVASTKVDNFDQEHIEAAIQKLSESRLIDPLHSTKVASMIKEDPKVMLDLMIKIAEANTGVSEGYGVQKGEDYYNESDPDGWMELLEQRN